LPKIELIKLDLPTPVRPTIKKLRISTI